MQCTFDPSKIIINQKILNVNVNECFNIDTQVNINMENKKSHSSVQLKENERIMNSESNQSQINSQTSFIDFKAMDGVFKKMHSISKLQFNIPIINKLSRTDSFKCLSDQIRMNQYMSLYQQSNPAHIKDLAMKKIPQLSLLKQKIKKRPVFQSIKFNVLNQNQNQLNNIDAEPKNCLENKIIIPIDIQKQSKSNNHSPVSPLRSTKKNNSKMNELNEEYLLDLGIPTRTSSKIEGNPNRISRKCLKKIKSILLELDNKYQTINEKDLKHYTFALNNICYSLVIEKKKKTILCLTKTEINSPQLVKQNESDIMKEMLVLKESIETTFLKKKRHSLDNNGD